MDARSQVLAGQEAGEVGRRGSTDRELAMWF